MHVSLPLALALATALALPGTPLLAESATTAAAATPAAAAPAPILPAITVSTVGTRMMRDRIVTSGFVSPIEQVQVQPLVEGQPIEALFADVGDVVQAGQVLARLSRSSLDLQKSQLTASLASARANIAQSEAQVVDANASAAEAQRVADRTAALKKAGSASTAAAAVSALSRVSVATQTLEATRAQLALVEAQSANIDLQLLRTEVVAPVSGEIVERNAQVGSIATAATSAMFTLIRNSELELRSDVAESDLLRLAVGQTAMLTVSGATTPIKGSVRLVEPTIDATTRMGRARIKIDDATQIRSGMFVEADVLVAERETIAVPVTALGKTPDGIAVMRVADGTVSRVLVKTGIRDGGWVEITEGLALGDTVVTKAGAFVRQGDKINPIPAKTN
jgi:HlyD family secretion protein